ncbi:MAG: hypothetical protein MHMPM18_000866 [Marteilia pararefringens]
MVKAILAIFEFSYEELEESHSNSEPDAIIDDPAQLLSNKSISNSGESLLVDANYTWKDRTEKWFEHPPILKRRTHAENIFRAKKGFTHQALRNSAKISPKNVTEIRKWSQLCERQSRKNKDKV